MFSQQQLGQLLTQTLGETLSERELQTCLTAVEILEPPVAKLFWQSTNANPGIYIVLAGRVRLLDSSNNLITTLGAGVSFGEVTLFGEEDFRAYAARASHNLKLCFLNEKALQPLMTNDQIRQHLFKRAEIWDLLLLCYQNSQLPRNSSPKQTLKALSLFEQHNLETGSLCATLGKDDKLWLLRRGELLHSDGHRLTPGNIYPPQQRGSWQATQPTIAYCLRNSDWQTALQYCPHLAALVDSGSTVACVEDIETYRRTSVHQEFAKESNVIAFRQPTSPPKQKQKLQRAYFPNPKVRVGQVWGRLTKRYPFFAQQSASDCGAACLVMIARYWGKRLNVNRLRDLANVSRSGASLRGLTAAAESIGFTTRPVKASLDKLAQQPLPAIVHWEGKHYIVVYEITPKRVIVGDPAIGQRNLTHAQFKAGWTGNALLLQPTALLKETEEASTPFWQFFELVKPHWQVLLEVFIASVFIQLFGLVTPLFTQLLLDRVIVQGSVLTLTAVGLGLLIFGLFRVAMTGLRQYLLDHTANRVGLALMVGFIKHTFRLPLAFFESRYVGDIVSRVQENQKIQRFLTGEALSIMLDLLTVSRPKSLASIKK